MNIVCDKCGKIFYSPDHTEITTCEDCENKDLTGFI